MPLHNHIPKRTISSKPIQSLNPRLTRNQQNSSMAMASEFTLQELRAFHTIDRRLYWRLVHALEFDPYESKKVVAFWMWLERKGCRNFVFNLQELPIELLNGLANEAITCLNSLIREPLRNVDDKVPVMRRLIGEDFCARFVYHNRERGVREIERFVKNVCERAFSDIVPNGFEPLAINGGFRKQHSSNGQGNGYPIVAGNQSANVKQVLSKIPETDRTLFITFSKGRPISRKELQSFITRKYGNCVESIHMKVHPQALFARVVVLSPSVIHEILGGNELAKLSINGKDAWARRFVLKHHQEHSQKAAAGQQLN